MVPEVRTKLPLAAAACDRLQISRLWVFGSATGHSGGRMFDSESDIDFLVEVDRRALPLRGWSDPFWKLWIELEDIFAPRRIQMIESGRVANPSLLQAITRTRELIYDRPRAKAPG